MPACIYEILHVGGRLQMLALTVDIRACIRRHAPSVPVSRISSRCERTSAARYFATFHENHVISRDRCVNVKPRCQLIVYTGNRWAVIEFFLSVKPTAILNCIAVQVENIREDVAGSRKLRLPISQTWRVSATFGRLLVEYLKYRLFFPKTCSVSYPFFDLSFFNKL